VTAATLWIEITIAGAAYLAAITFALLAYFHMQEIPWVDKDTLPYVSVIAVGISYVLGIGVHRLTQGLGTVLSHVWAGDPWWLRPVFASHDGRVNRDIQAVFWQRGSDRLHREIDFQYALLALLRSLVLSIPLLALAVAAWFSITPKHQNAVRPTLLGGSVAVALVVISYFRQAAHLQQLWQATTRMLASGQCAMTVESAHPKPTPPVAPSPATPAMNDMNAKRMNELSAKAEIGTPLTPDEAKIPEQFHELFPPWNTDR